MNTKQILEFLQAQIHTVVLATADGQGLPVTCAIDIMDSADGALYFLTAKGKALYARLKACPTVALTGIRGESTMTRVAISLRGRARECGRAVLQRLLEKNPYMYEIYPTARSREGLTAFVVDEGSGEWFDLSKKPIERIGFALGDAAVGQDGEYHVTDGCIGCGACLAVCPQNCIALHGATAVIEQQHCLRCGNCLAACPAHAITKR